MASVEPSNLSAPAALAPSLGHLAISAEGFVFDPTTGESYQVSRVGLLVLNALRDAETEEAIIQRLTEAYDVTPEEARRDVVEFRVTLQSFGLLPTS